MHRQTDRQTDGHADRNTLRHPLERAAVVLHGRFFSTVFTNSTFCEAMHESTTPKRQIFFPACSTQ